jgi:hypothetical protein
MEQPMRIGNETIRNRLRGERGRRAGGEWSDLGLRKSDQWQGHLDPRRWRGGRIERNGQPGQGQAYVKRERRPAAPDRKLGSLTPYLPSHGQMNSSGKA